jgi:hypothetical protein
MMVAADPISMAIESDTRFRRAFIPTNAAVLLMNDIRMIQDGKQKSLIDFDVAQNRGLE